MAITNPIQSVTLDRSEFEQALVNLALNARDAVAERALLHGETPTSSDWSSTSSFISEAL